MTDDVQSGTASDGAPTLINQPQASIESAVVQPQICAKPTEVAQFSRAHDSEHPIRYVLENLRDEGQNRNSE